MSALTGSKFANYNTVCDQYGRPAIRIGNMPDGSPAVELLSPLTGKVVAIANVSEQHDGVLALVAEDASIRATICCDAHGEPVLTAFDDRGQPYGAEIVDGRVVPDSAQK